MPQKPCCAICWLTRRGGTLRLGTDGQTWYLFFGDSMDYSLTTTPVADKHGGVLRQITSGQRLECPGTWATRNEALAAGLESLRKQMGW